MLCRSDDLAREQVPLLGGTANRGRIFRVGNTVHRPRGEHSDAVHALLRHLSARGFDGAPGVIVAEGQVEVLDYLEGQCAVEPQPPWARTDAALRSVGQLLARFHRHSRGFVGAQRRWQRDVPARWSGGLVTHNDVNPANVVFREGIAVGLIDFDLAGPGCAAWDLAITACFWAPLRAPVDVPQPGVGNPLHRFGVLLDGYGADADLRRDAAEACPEANSWIAAVIHDASLQGHPAFGRVWEAQAGMYARAGQWIATHLDQLRAAA